MNENKDSLIVSTVYEGISGVYFFLFLLDSYRRLETFVLLVILFSTKYLHVAGNRYYS